MGRKKGGLDGRGAPYAQTLVPTSIQPGFQAGWFEVTGRVEHKTNKRSGKPSRFWYDVRCRDCGQHFLKTRGQINFAANYYNGVRRCQHAGRNRELQTRLITTMLGNGFTLAQLAAIAQLVSDNVDPSVVGKQYELSAETCRRVTADLSVETRLRIQQLAKHHMVPSDAMPLPVNSQPLLAILENMDGTPAQELEDPEDGGEDGRDNPDA